MNLRHQVILTITPVLQQKASLKAQFDKTIATLPIKDRGLFHELSFGSLRYFHLLDAIAKKLIAKPLKNKDLDIYAAIILGLYQVKFLRIPDHAAISETVEAVKKLKKLWATKLVNGVLRNFLREQEKIENQLSSDEQFSHPEWLRDRIKLAWPNQWQTILEANNQQGPLTLRVNRLKTSRKDYVTHLNADYALGEHSDCAVVLKDLVDVNQLPGFETGLVSVQDEAAQLAANLLELKPQNRVLDLCCAPGGKTCHILETENQLSELVALDIEASRMMRVRENLTRLGLSATLKVADGLAAQTWRDDRLFDRILLDAPCSATGVIRRHPDIKLLRRDDDLAQLSKLQYQLLEKIWPLLKPEGILVYATCSILPEENTQVVEKFVSSHNDAIPIKLESNWGIEQPIGRQLFPKINGHDGFYYAKLVKHK